MEEGNDSAFEFGSTAGIDCGGGEGFPDDGLADVGSDEEGDAGTETVTLLKKFVEKDDNETRDNELHDEQDTDASTKVRWLAVEAREDGDTGLTRGQNNGQD